MVKCITKYKFIIISILYADIIRLLQIHCLKLASGNHLIQAFKDQ